MLAFTKDSASPKFRTLLKGQSCKAQLYVKWEEKNDFRDRKEWFYLRRIPISQIPYEDETKCAQWLHELFQEKVIKTFFFSFYFLPMESMITEMSFFSLFIY